MNDVRCTCDKETCEIISCEDLDILFEDNSEGLDITLDDNSENIKVDIVEVGPILYNNTAIVRRGTCEYWDSKSTFISEDNVFYLYLDYMPKTGKSGETYYAPGLKIGDGNSYLIDLPFIDTNEVHITQNDVDRWNNKWSGYISTANPENLIFTTG